VRRAFTRPAASLTVMNHRSRTRNRRRDRLADARLDVLAVAWLARGVWRVRRGRFPWQAAPARRRAG
jgi:hypothetical protein